ncbi:MAG: hypothetical protein C4325_08490 [Blastocatellia bacterium]
MDHQSKPKVSVCMITYNHEPYIAQAIEGVLMQETDFPVELVIGEDCSTDNTRKICEDYAKRYPDKIRLHARESNLGMSQNFVKTICECRGEYIAFCEGDDFWTYEQKLAEQVEFLEKNRNYSGACTAVRVLEDATGMYFPLPAHDRLGEYEDITVERYLTEGILINTCTFVARRAFIDTSIFEGNDLACDFAVFILAMDKGPVRFHNVPTAVYRVNQGSVTFSRDWGKFAKLIHDCLETYDQHTNGRYAASVAIKRRYTAMVQTLSDARVGILQKAALIGRYALLNRLRPNEVKSLIGYAFPRAMKKAMTAKRKLRSNVLEKRGSTRGLQSPSMRGAPYLLASSSLYMGP